MVMTRWLSAAFCALALSLASTAEAAQRIALLIGNGDYRHTARLDGSIADAKAMAATLTALGFVVELLVDANKEEMAAALVSFGERAEGADTALFYFSGHAMEIGPRNHLIPVDARLARASDAGLQAIPLDAARDSAAGARRLSIVIVDACRNNQFQGAEKSGTKGLKPINAAPRQLIAFATAPGTVAFAGASGSLSPYTRALTEALADPRYRGLDVRQLFGGLSPRVLALTEGEQEPYMHAKNLSLDTVTIIGQRGSELTSQRPRQNCADCPIEGGNEQPSPTEAPTLESPRIIFRR